MSVLGRKVPGDATGACPLAKNVSVLRLHSLPPPQLGGQVGIKTHKTTLTRHRAQLTLYKTSKQLRRPKCDPSFDEVECGSFIKNNSGS